MLRFKVALIGCGAVTDIHHQALTHLENAEIVGVYDKSLARAQEFAKERGLQVFESMEDLLASDANVVGICTPSGLHASLALQCMHAGKHVMVEKPIAITEQDCDAILAAERETGKVCSAIAQLRFFDDIRRAKEILESGELGKPILCDLYMKYYRKPEYYANSWKGTIAMDGGGALMNQGIHGIDVLRYLVGEPKRINGTVRTLVHDIEVEDTAVATVEFENGALGVIEGTTSVSPGFPRRLEIHCQKGGMVIEESRLVSVDLPNAVANTEKSNYDSSSDPMNFSFEGHRRQYANLFAAIEGTEPLYYTAADAVESVKTVLRIYRSSREGKTT